MRISSHDNLHMVVYVLGCPSQGEMVVTLIQDGDEVKYSILTDCYLETPHQVKLFARWCRRIGVLHFDAMIFTHPDVDHCTGVSNLVNEMDSIYSSLLFIPEQMFGVLNVSEEQIIGPFREITKHYEKNDKLIIQDREKKERKVMLEIEFQAPMQTPTTMQFIQLATDKYFINRHCLYRENKASHNDLSLVYTINYLGNNYLYCADLPGEYVKEIDDEYLHNVQFVKIPHHGSKGCIEFPSRLLANAQDGLISATTTYHGMADTRRLPAEEVLQLYSKMGNVYCSGPRISPIPEKVYKYGGIRIDCLFHEVDLKASCWRNAYQYIKAQDEY